MLVIASAIFVLLLVFLGLAMKSMGFLIGSGLIYIQYFPCLVSFLCIVGVGGGGLSKEHSISVQWGPKLILAPLGKPKGVWPPMSYYRMFYHQTSTPAPTMDNVPWLKHGKCCMQKTNSWPKGPLNLKALLRLSYVQVMISYLLWFSQFWGVCTKSPPTSLQYIVGSQACRAWSTTRFAHMVLSTFCYSAPQSSFWDVPLLGSLIVQRNFYLQFKVDVLNSVSWIDTYIWVVNGRVWI